MSACRSCGAPFGSPVAFCPFCGAAQAEAAAVEPTPLPDRAAAPPSPRPPSASPWSRAGAVAPPATPAPRVPPAPTASTTPAAKRRARWPLGPGASLALLALIVLGLWLGNAPLPTGTLLVKVRGPAGAVTTGSVLIDGNRVGAPGTPVRVGAGPHEVSFAESGFVGETRRVEVGTDGQMTLELTVREAPARLTVTTVPAGAAVRVAGRAPAPAPLAVELPAGNYDVSVSAPGFVPRSVPVRLGRGEARGLAVELSASQVTLRLGPPPFERGALTGPAALRPAPAGAESGFAASGDVPGGEVLPAGTGLQVLGTAGPNETWLQVRAGNRVGFVRGAEVEHYDNWAARNGVAGLVDGVTGNLRLIVSGRPLPLAGLRLPEGTPSPALSRITASLLGVLRGTGARCLPQDPVRFVCKTAEGRDIGEMFLLNGAAMLGAGALPYYEDAERTARERGRGLWAD